MEPKIILLKINSQSNSCQRSQIRLIAVKPKDIDIEYEEECTYHISHDKTMRGITGSRVAIFLVMRQDATRVASNPNPI